MIPVPISLTERDLLALLVSSRTAAVTRAFAMEPPPGPGPG